MWIDDLELRRREPDRPYDLTPSATASSSAHTASAVLDGGDSAWQSEPGPQWLALDFLRPREYGGLVVDWVAGRQASDYSVESSDDGTSWSTQYTVRGGNGGRDWIHLPEHESRHLRLRMAGAPTTGVAIRELTVEPVDWADSPTAFIQRVAASAVPGTYPRYLGDTQVYWTVLGASGDGRRALMNEDGALEVGQGRFSIEPFLRVGDRFVSWADAARRQRLERGDLPIPSVEWTVGDVGLDITAFAAGPAGRSSLLARYRLRNAGRAGLRPTLYLALRPLQVNPPWQFLGTPGGAAPIREIRYSGRAVRADSQIVVAVTPPGGFGASTLDRGDIVEHLRSGRIPTLQAVADSSGWSSGVLAYPIGIPAGDSADVWIEVPLYGDGTAVPRSAGAAEAARYGERRLAATAASWAALVDRVGIRLPPSASDLVATIKANLAYILINREGAAIEPGARSYRRSWIRDGAMISSALLRLGQFEAVRGFLEWYAPYQYPNGKVPCCVDARGADPVPENDSHGQLIYLAMEYYRQTRRPGDAGPDVASRARRCDTSRLAPSLPPDAGVRDGGESRLPWPGAPVDQPRGVLGEGDALLLGRLLRAQGAQGCRGDGEGAGPPAGAGEAGGVA